MSVYRAVACYDALLHQFGPVKYAARFTDKHGKHLKLRARHSDFAVPYFDCKPFGYEDKFRLIGRRRGHFGVRNGGQTGTITLKTVGQNEGFVKVRESVSYPSRHACPTGSKVASNIQRVQY